MSGPFWNMVTRFGPRIMQVWSTNWKKYSTKLQRWSRNWRTSRTLNAWKDLNSQHYTTVANVETWSTHTSTSLGDMTRAMKILDKYDEEEQKTRGHNLKLQKSHSRLNFRKYFFSQRAVNLWNNLPKEVVEAPSMDSFKSRLDKAWNSWDTLYTPLDPGTEPSKQPCSSEVSRDDVPKPCMHTLKLRATFYDNITDEFARIGV